MVNIPVDKRGFNAYMKSFGNAANQVVAYNFQLNDSKKKVYLKFLESKKKDFTLSSGEIQSLIATLNDQIVFFDSLVSKFEDQYRRFKRNEKVFNNETFIFATFEDLLSYMRGLLALYEEERLALTEEDVKGFYELFDQERVMYKRITKLINSIKIPEVVLTIESLKPKDRRGSSLVFTCVSLLFCSAVLAPGCFNEKLNEGFYEIGGGASLIGSSAWDGIETVGNWMWDGINLLGYHIPNWGAGLSVLVLIVLALAAVSRRR